MELYVKRRSRAGAGEGRKWNVVRRFNCAARRLKPRRRHSAPTRVRARSWAPCPKFCAHSPSRAATRRRTRHPPLVQQDHRLEHQCQRLLSNPLAWCRGYPELARLAREITATESAGGSRRPGLLPQPCLALRPAQPVRAVQSRRRHARSRSRARRSYPGIPAAAAAPSTRCRSGVHRSTPSPVARC